MNSIELFQSPEILLGCCGILPWISWRFLEDSWRILGGFWEDSGRILGGFLEDSWRILGDSSEVFEVL